MTTRDQADKLLTALSGYMEAAPLRLDERDAAFLEILDAVFAFAFSEESEELAACAYIGILPAGGRREEALRALMEGNYAWAGTGGGILGLEADSGLVCLSQRFRPDRESAPGFIEKIARQAGLAQYWRKRLEPEQTISATAMRA